MGLKEAALVAVSVGLAVAASEAIVRRYASPPRYLQSGPRSGQGESRSWLYLSTPSGRRLRPNVRGVLHGHFLNGRDIEMRTNSLGFRGPEPDWSRRPRALFLGDSVTLADYLDEPETFVRLLGERLGWETLNAGVGSIGIGTERAILEELGERIRPDVVVLNLYLNDVDSSPAIELLPVPPLLKVSWIAQHAFQAASTVRYLLSERDAAFARGEDWERWRREVTTRYPSGPGDWRRDRPAFNALIHRSLRDWGSAWSEGAVEKILVEVDRIRERALSLGAALKVALHPVRPQVEAELLADEPQRRLAAALAGRGIPHLDLLPLLRAAHRAEGRPLFYDQCHHTPEGSRRVAEAMAPWLAR